MSEIQIQASTSSVRWSEWADGSEWDWQMTPIYLKRLSCFVFRHRSVEVLNLRTYHSPVTPSLLRWKEIRDKSKLKIGVLNFE